MIYNFQSVKETQQFIELLKSELLLELPGVKAHLQLAPAIRLEDIKTGTPPSHAMESAVLIILYPVEQRLHTVVILRNEYEGAHSGQISLPGGKTEESDTDFKYTALREAHEEIGINPSEMEIIGQLSLFYVRPSNFIVYPFIAYCTHRPEFHPDTKEVKRIIEVDIFNDIRNSKKVSKTLIFKNIVRVDAPGFMVSGEFMWGATAMIFSELIQVMGKTMKKLKKISKTDT